MNLKVTRVDHKYSVFPNRFIVTVCIEPAEEFFGEMENVYFDVIIEKPESELRLLTFADIERLASERTLTILASIKK